MPGWPRPTLSSSPTFTAALSVGKALMVVPQAVADKLPAEYKAQVRILRNGQRLDTLGLGVLSIPMYNLPEAADAPHTKGRGQINRTMWRR